MVVAIDGPAGTGKSSVSREVAAGTGFFYLNSGRFYRAITRCALRAQIPIEDRSALLQVARETEIDVRGEEFLVNGVPLDQELHTAEIDNLVAQVSSFPEVRDVVNERLKEIAGHRDVVVEGRDMSTVVFPDAEIKIYLDADPEVRALRRFQQQGGKGELHELEESIRERDRLDRTKDTGRLVRAPDAIYLDTTDLTLQQVCEKVIATIHEKN
jgi:CMP/dCMP kinase